MAWDTDLRIKRINQTLKDLFNCDLKLEQRNINQLKAITEKYSKIKNSILSESCFNSYQKNPEYVKSLLVLEAISLFLTEIAPKRLNKKNTRSKNAK